MSRTALFAALGLALSVFVCHKQVLAAPIVAAFPLKQELTILLPTGEPHTFKVADGFFARSVPLPGDYFVVYDDGYQSHSPKAAFEEGYHAASEGASILMGPQNPTGWKLEELLPQIAREIEAKTLKIADDPRTVARLVAENNGMIVWHLEEAEALQRTSYVALDSMGPNEGPLGKPRIGVGSNPA